MTKLLGLGLLVLSFAACMKSTASGGGGATDPAPAGKRAPLGDTMADATPYSQGATIAAPLGCSTSSYAKFDFPVGQPVKLEVAIEGPEGACMSASYLKASGGAVDGMMKELCVGRNGTETWDVEGLEGGSFLQVSEAAPCKGATIKVVIP